VSTGSPDLAWRRRSRARWVAFDLGRIREAGPLAALLGLTAVLYLWALSRNGWANEYYAAAVQAGAHNWKAFLFGSLDAANYITVDKPPASLWLMELSSRLFGFSSFSMLLPQALEGVAAVALLYATVRRWFTRNAALLSGLIFAITPVAALMFRFDNPDALLVLLLVGAAYCLTCALEGGATRWLAFSGVALGFAFLAKELEAFLVVPPFALAYLVAAPVPLRRRLWQLALAGGVLLLVAGWWVTLVELWPASGRPYIGDSSTNSILQVIFGSNGLERISRGGGPGAGLGFSGPAGILRLFNAELGGQISWLLPAAAISLVAGALWTARRPRSDRTRAALLLWGGWFVVVAAVFSLMTGIIHPYYSSMLAPAIAVLAGVGGVTLWGNRERLAARLTLGAMLAVTGLWSYALLDRSPSWHPWLRFAVLIAGVLAAAATVAGRRLNREARAAAIVGLIAALAGPAAYTLNAVATSESGSNPSAGPAIASAGGFGRGGFPRAGSGPAPGSNDPSETVSRTLVSLLDQNSSRYTWAAATSSSQEGASLELATGRPVMAIGGFSGSDPAITLAHFKRLVADGKIHYYAAGGGFGGGAFGGLGGWRGGFGAPSARFPGSRAGFPGGGFEGGPPGGFSAPSTPFTGARRSGFPAGVREGGPPGGFGARGASRTTVSSEIQSWVQTRFKSRTVGRTTVYDLTQTNG
jgi:4-amino-4-deoxy-L-arabinose transferase-like glycosyltransferase